MNPFKFLLLTLLIVICPIRYVLAQQTLSDLYDQVKKQRLMESEDYAIREKRFLEQKNSQQKLYDDAQKALQLEEQRGDQYKDIFDRNEEVIKKQEDILKERSSDIAELHGVARQFAADLNGIQKSSLITAQFPDHTKLTEKLAASKELPSIKELEDLWMLALNEIAESGKVVKFQAPIITQSGKEEKSEVTRIGTFDAFADNMFLRYLPETGRFMFPGRQPSARYLSTVADINLNSTDFLPVPIDPTKGNVLDTLIQIPDTVARIKQGGIIGYIIIGIGIIGLLIAFERFIVLSLTQRKVNRQLNNKTPGKNPLGRIMQVYDNNPDVDTETLELKLDEAILKEIPVVERGLPTLSLIAAIAPLLGLLGTVVGIIYTFQSITLYGTGDPRSMSGGISTALVTTVEGLAVAIPMLLCHSFLTSKSNKLVNILDEKSKAFVALLAEINRLRKHHA